MPASGRQSPSTIRVQAPDIDRTLFLFMGSKLHTASSSVECTKAMRRCGGEAA